MTRPRKVALGLGAGAALLLALLVVTPLLFKDRIAERVKSALNASVNARVEWTGLGLTFLRNFPNLTLRLDDLSVVGTGTFEGDTLASIDQLRLVLDLPSVVRNWRRGDPLLIRALVLREPALLLRVQEDGTANWDIMRTADATVTDTTTSRGVAVSLRRMIIQNASVTLDNRATGLSASLFRLNQSLSGDFARESFLLRTSATAEEVSVRFAGVPYLTRVALDLTAELDANMAENQFTFRDNTLRLNDLALRLAGSLAQKENGTAIDLTFEAPATDFRHLVSLIPTIYAQDFQSLKTTGTMSVSGTVNGIHGDGSFPAFTLRATVDNGSFQYPDLPLPARDIGFDLGLDNPGGSLDSTVMNLSRFHAQIGNDPIDLSLRLRTPVSDPDIDVRLAGRVDLADVRRTMKLQGVDQLAGVITADAAVQTRLSALDRGQYDRVNARGAVDIRDLTLQMADLPHAIAIDETRLRLTPRLTELTSFRGRIGGSDIDMTGSLDNLLRFLLRGEELRGNATLRSARFDLNEWQSSGSLEIIPVPANLDFTLQADVAQLAWADLNLTDVEGTVRVKDQRVTLENLRMKGLGGTLGMNGYYDTTDPTRPSFDAALELTDLEIPASFSALTTIQRFAPVAGFARGTFSVQMGLTGALGERMMPIFSALSGQGSLQTSQLALEGFPPLDRMAGLLKLPQFTHPTFRAIRSTFAIRDGRLHVQPFDLQLGDFQLTVSGSNGIDQSLQYALRLQAPSALLGAEASRAITGLVTQAGRTGFDLSAVDVLSLGLQLGGTITDPSLGIDAGNPVGSVAGAIRQQAGQKAESLGQQVDSAAGAARQRAQAEADNAIAEAERRAESIREEARRVADQVRAEANSRADSLVARASGPVAQAAARLAADRLRREANARADQILAEADKRASDLVAEARRKGAD